MVIIWCEVNEAWSEASLVWLWSLCKACRSSERRTEIKLVIWCEEGEWISVYGEKVREVADGFIECEIRPYTPYKIDVEGERCIPSESIGIAISRVWHYNEMVEEALSTTVQSPIASVPVTWEGLYSVNEKNIFVHCDIDGVFSERFSLDKFLDEVYSVPNGCIGGCDEYADIEEVLTNSHNRGFIDCLGGVYLNCGMMVFNGIGLIDVDDLEDFLAEGDSFCLEQDYLNFVYPRHKIDERYNYTFRKRDYLDNSNSLMLPYFVHYYGKVKPFLANDERVLASLTVSHPSIFEYWDLWFRNVMEIKGVLSKNFISVCRENFIKCVR